MSKQLRLDVAQLTDVGRKRPHNEDNMAYVIPKDSQVMAKKGALFIVADGMGGHAAGEVASEIAVDTVSTAYYQDENDEIPLSLMNAIKRANALIHQRAAENMMRSGMGTTCVAAVVHSGVAYIANVGDSRAYMVRNGHSKQVSQDHSWVEEQVRAGLLTKDQARSHAQRNVITRALGTQAEVDVDVFTEVLEDGDTFVLCSDGLSGLVGEDDLRAIINQYLPQESVYHLVERANENGGPDNITAIVIHIQEAGDDVPSALQHPVRVGSGGHVADESTAVLDRVPTSSLGMSSSTMSVEEGRVISRPLPSPASSLFTSLGDNTAPLVASVAPKGKKKHNRLLFPTMLLIILLVAAGAASGYYFFLRPSDGQADLNQADTLITQAKDNINTNPGNALISLTKAQGYLRTAKNGLLNPQQSNQLNTLQNDFTGEFKSALTTYNKQSSVTLLPCATLDPVTLKPTESTAAIATVPADKTHTFSYILGLDGDLYQVNAQNTLQKVTKVVGTDKILLIASDDTYLYTVTEAKATSGFTYRLHAFKVQDEQLVEKVAGGTVIQSSLLQNGQVPQLMTSWGGDIYVIATSSQSNQNQATVLNYNVNKLGDGPTETLISISTSLVSAAALSSKQLFLLHSDGDIKSLDVTASKSTSKPVEMGVLLPVSIATPWSQDVQTFNVATPIATPTAPIAKFLTIPAPTAQTAQTLLSAGAINGVPHLYVVDNTNHRVLNFTIKSTGAAQTAAVTPTASATNRAGGGVIGSGSGPAGPSVNLEQQYVSASIVSDVKGLSFDARTNQINLLTGMQSSSASNQVQINVSSNTACAAHP